MNNSIFEYTMEISFLNLLLEKKLINAKEYRAIKRKIVEDYRIDTGVEKSN